jgi:hypothetical protein
MKQLNVTFEDKEHKELEAAKNKSGKNWHDFLLDLVR